MIRVACVGITVMDRIYYVEGLPTESGKYVAKNYTEVGGGPAATAAVAAARLGAQVDFIGRVGDDDTGNSLLAELESWGVNTRYTKRYNEAKSSQSAIMVDTKGERIIINYPSPDLLPDAEWLEEIDFSQWDVVLADVRWHEGAKKAFTLARQAGMSEVYLHQVFSGRRNPSRDRLLCLCIGLEATLEETQCLLKQSAYAQLYPKSKRDAIITYGILHHMELHAINDKLFAENEKTLF